MGSSSLRGFGQAFKGFSAKAIDQTSNYSREFGAMQFEVVVSQYIPPSTRASMAALGIRYVTKGGLSLPPHELPGEQAWRTDFLRWQARKVIGRAYLLPGPMREAYLARAEDAQLEEGIMTELEVHGIFECARRTLATFSSDPVTRDEWYEFTQTQDAQREELEARRKAIFGVSDGKAAAQ